MKNICQQCQKPSLINLNLTCDHKMCVQCAQQMHNSEYIEGEEFYKIICNQCGVSTIFSKNYQQKYEPSELEQAQSKYFRSRSPTPRGNVYQSNLFQSPNMKTKTKTGQSKSPNKYSHVQSHIQRSKNKPQLSFDEKGLAHQLKLDIQQGVKCYKHGNEYTLFDVDSKIFACVDCVFSGQTHKNHHVVNLKAAQKYIQEELLKTKNESVEKISLMKQFIKNCNHNQKTIINSWENQKDQVEQQFDKLFEHLKTRKNQILSHLKQTYEEKLEKNSQRQENLEFLREQLIEEQNQTRAIEEQLDENAKQNYFYSETRILNNCFKKYDVTSEQYSEEQLNLIDFSKINLDQQIDKYFIQNIKHIDFEQIKQEVPQKKRQRIIIPENNKDVEWAPAGDIEYDNDQQKALFTGSDIIKFEIKSKKFYSLLPNLKGKYTSLLYKMSKDGASSVTFHKRCDDKGPYLVFINVNGNIFGYFMPHSFVMENRFQSCSNSWIFSVQNNQGHDPCVFPVKSDKNYIGLYQSDGNPCLGSTIEGKQDLMINFDNPQASYSVLGNAYGCEQKDPFDPFYLAGTATNWKVKEIEVYSIQ